jgi:hypothetical protein
MKRLRIENSNQAGSSLPTPIAEGNDAVAVLTATCKVLPEQFTERVTNLLDEECPGTKPLFRLKDNSCASTIFRYDLNDRGKDAVLEQATPEVLERIKSECRAGTAVVQKSVHLAFAPLVPEGGSQYRNHPGGPLLKSPTARGLEALHKKFWEVYGFKCSPETKSLYVVTANVWMEASYVRIWEDQQEEDRVPAKVHELFKADGNGKFGNLPPPLWVPCFAEIYAILAEITTSVRGKGGGNLKNFIFAIDTAKGAKALFNAAKSFFRVSDADFLALFPVYGTGVHPSLIVRKWCLWLYAARLLAMCKYYCTGEILGGQTIPQASSYPEPGRGRVQVPPQQKQWQQPQQPQQWPQQPQQWPRQQQQWPRQQQQQQWQQWPRQQQQQQQPMLLQRPRQPMQMHMPGEPQQNRQQHAISGFYGSHESGIIMRKNGRPQPKNNPINQVKATQRYDSYVSNTGGETPAWLKAAHDNKRAQGRDHVSNVAQRKAQRDKGDPENPKTPVNFMCAHVNTDGKRCSYEFEEGTTFSLTTSLTSFQISHPAKGYNSNGKKCKYTINLSSEDSRKTLVSIALKRVAYRDKLTLLDQLFGRVTSRELPRATQQGKPFTDEQMKVKKKKHGTDLKEIETAIQDIKKKLEEKENKKMHASFE